MYKGQKKNFFYNFFSPNILFPQQLSGIVYIVDLHVNVVVY